VVIAGSMSHHKENSIYRTRKASQSTKKPNRTPEQRNKYHQCAFYAFDGKTGSLRWKHESTDFQPELHSLKMLHRPENFKTEATHIADLGEVDWRAYRRSILAQLPHSWQRREDTQLRLAHFNRKKPRSREKTLQAAVPTAHIPGLADWKLAHQAQEHIEKPNVLVAHLREGIEVIHLYTGRRLTQLTLGAGTWDDINADGVIDHAQVFGTLDHAERLNDESPDTKEAPVCFAEVRTGVPVVGELFNATVCQSDHFDLYTPFSTQKHIEAVAPVTYRSPTRETAHLDTIFFAGNGQITSFAQDGGQRWEAETICTWDAGLQAESIEELLLVPLHEGIQEQYLLAVAPRAFAILHPEGGTVVSEMDLPEDLTATVSVGDIDHDGINDLVFTSATAVHAYVLARRPSSFLFQLLIGGLIAVILGVMLTGFVEGSKSQKAKD